MYAHRILFASTMQVRDLTSCSFVYTCICHIHVAIHTCMLRLPSLYITIYLFYITCLMLHTYYILCHICLYLYHTICLYAYSIPLSTQWVRRPSP